MIQNMNTNLENEAISVKSENVVPDLKFVWKSL